MEPGPASQLEHREIGLGTILSFHEQEQTFSPRGIHLRRENDRWHSTKSRYEIKLGEDGACRDKSNAVYSGGRYIAVVAAGKVTIYGKRTS